MLLSAACVGGLLCFDEEDDRSLDELDDDVTDDSDELLLDELLESLLLILPRASRSASSFSRSRLGRNFSL